MFLNCATNNSFLLSIPQTTYMRILYAFLFAALLLPACSKEKYEETTFTVASQYGSCTGWTGTTSPCIQVKEEGSAQFRGFSTPIEGFNYETGFEYVLKVRIYDIENPPADGSSKRYVLVKIISKN